MRQEAFAEITDSGFLLWIEKMTRYDPKERASASELLPEVLAEVSQYGRGEISVRVLKSFSRRLSILYISGFHLLFFLFPFLTQPKGVILDMDSATAERTSESAVGNSKLPGTRDEDVVRVG